LTAKKDGEKLGLAYPDGTFTQRLQSPVCTVVVSNLDKLDANAIEMVLAFVKAARCILNNCSGIISRRPISEHDDVDWLDIAVVGGANSTVQLRDDCPQNSV